MTVKDEIDKFLDKALPMVEHGEITINIKVHNGKVKKVNKGILEEAYVKENQVGNESSK